MLPADVGNKGAMVGCEAGNCLRSHINKTETHDAMSMVTKAGLETRQLVIGITSYGRSFRMSQTSCSGPLCTFEGSRSQSLAYAAPCTNTRGYMANAEIKDIIQSHSQFSVFQDFVDKDSDSNILIYGNPGAVDWIAYMDGDLKANRVRWIESFNFGGSGDWAIDLESHTNGGNGDDQNGGGGGDGDGMDGGDGNDDDDDEVKLEDLICPPGDNPGSLDRLVDKADSLDEECVQLYAMEILHSNLLDSLSLFKTNSKDYDDKFVWYERWTKEHIQPRLDDFMALGHGKGLKYFDCYWSHPGQKEKKGSCVEMPHMWDTKNSWTIRFELSDKKGFFDALEAEFGIEESWIKFDYQYSTFGCENSFVNAPGSGIINTPCRTIMQTKKNYPMKGPDKNIHVFNPKKVIEGAAQNVTALRESLFSSYVMVGVSYYDRGPNGSSVTDAISGYSMPVLQLAQAIESMKDIKDIGEKAASDAKKNLIVKILSIVFMVVPFAGDVIGPVFGSAAAISRIALLIGEVGNAALTVGEIIKDPQSAPFAIMDLIAATGITPGRLGKEDAITKASKVRALMKAEDIAKFPEEFKKNDALVQTIVRGLCGRK